MSVQRRERVRHAAICALAALDALTVLAGALASARAADLFDDLYRRGQQQNGTLKTLHRAVHRNDDVDAADAAADGARHASRSSVRRASCSATSSRTSASS